MGSVIVFLTGCVLMACCIARAQSNLFLLVIPPGDLIGQSQTFYTTNEADFSGAGDGFKLAFSAFGFGILFDAPGEFLLAAGVYPNAVLWPGNGSAPGIRMPGNSRVCDLVCGSFEILEINIEVLPFLHVDRFWAKFSQSCQCQMPAVTGEIRYHSKLVVPFGRTLRVPADFPTIQAALDATDPNMVDTVIVSPGLYRESVQFAGKRARLVSAEGASRTCIMAPPGSVAVIMNGTTPESVLTGFTITNSATAISVTGSPTIFSNDIVRCETGINCGAGSFPTIRKNRIIGCSGPAIQLASTIQFASTRTLLIDGNTIEDNGGGIGMQQAGTPLIQNNVIRRNHGDGISMANYCDANIVTGKVATSIGRVAR